MEPNSNSLKQFQGNLSSGSKYHSKELLGKREAPEISPLPSFNRYDLKEKPLTLGELRMVSRDLKLESYRVKSLSEKYLEMMMPSELPKFYKEKQAIPQLTLSSKIFRR